MGRTTVQSRRLGALEASLFPASIQQAEPRAWRPGFVKLAASRTCEESVLSEKALRQEPDPPLHQFDIVQVILPLWISVASSVKRR